MVGERMGGEVAWSSWFCDTIGAIKVVGVVEGGGEVALGTADVSRDGGALRLAGEGEASFFLRLNPP